MDSSQRRSTLQSRKAGPPWQLAFRCGTESSLYYTSSQSHGAAPRNISPQRDAVTSQEAHPGSLAPSSTVWQNFLRHLNLRSVHHPGGAVVRDTRGQTRSPRRVMFFAATHAQKTHCAEHSAAGLFSSENRPLATLPGHLKNQTRGGRPGRHHSKIT